MVIYELMPPSRHNNDKKQPSSVNAYMFYKLETNPYIDGMSTIVPRPETLPVIKSVNGQFAYHKKLAQKI